MEAVGEASLGFSGYCRLAAQSMLQAAMEVEAADFIGRASYERRGEGQSAYRNGYKSRRVTTGEGPLELLVPQTRNCVEPFQTAILGAFQRRSADDELAGAVNRGGPAAYEGDEHHPQ
jgi:transposase-like protein